MGMGALQQASVEIRDEFKAGEHVVFGAHVDENMGDRIQITVLGATDLEAGLPAADVAPVSEHIMTASPKAKRAHESKLAFDRAVKAPLLPKQGKGKGKGKDPVDQNTFDFMEDGNQRGIFDDLSSRNLYEGEDLDVPSYLRRGVKIAV